MLKEFVTVYACMTVTVGPVAQKAMRGKLQCSSGAHKYEAPAQLAVPTCKTSLLDPGVRTVCWQAIAPCSLKVYTASVVYSLGHQ